MSNRSPGATAARFAWLVTLFALPFWALAAASQWMLLPHLPVSALMAICPALAAMMLVARVGGWRSVRRLSARVLDARRLRAAGAFLTLAMVMPVLLAVAYALMVAFNAPLPAENRLDWGIAVLSLAPFLLAAMLEEIGWTAYLTERLEPHLGWIRTGLAIGLIWALWHVVPFVQTGRTAGWIVGHMLVTVFTRVLMVRMYGLTGRSVFGASLFHASANVAYFQFPNGGSHYDPVWFLPVLGAACVAAALAPSDRRSA